MKEKPFVELTTKEWKKYFGIDKRTRQEIDYQARQTQEMIDMNISESGGVGKNPTDTNFHSGQNAAKDMSNDRPTVVKRVKDKSYVRRD